MKKILLSLISAIILNPTLLFSQADSTFSLDINTGDDVNEVYFEIYHHDGSDEISSIKYWPSKPDRINILALLKDDYAHYIDFDDYNFDGYLDMYIHDPCMILGNCHGRIYLFNPDMGEFRHDSRFDDMTSVTALPESKTIFSSNRSAAGTLFNNETFQWESNDLILVKRVSQNLTDGDDMLMYLYKVEERDKNGDLIVIEEKVLEEPFLE